MRVKLFVAQIPGYTLETEDGFEVEYFKAKHLPDYMEIIYKGNIVPFSKFMFNSEEKCGHYLERDFESIR